MLRKPNIDRLTRRGNIAGLLRATHPRQDPNTRHGAIRALGKLRDQRAVEPLLDIVERAGALDPTHSAAIRALGEIGDRRALPVLFKLVPGNGLAAQAVGAIGDPSSVPVLIASLNTSAKFSVFNVLAGSFTPTLEIMTALTDYLDRVEWIRPDQLTAFCGTGHPTVDGHLKSLLTARSDAASLACLAEEYERRRAAELDPADRAELAVLRLDPAAAAQHGSEGVDGIVRALGRTSVDVQRSAVVALLDTDDPRALVRVLEHLRRSQSEPPRPQRLQVPDGAEIRWWGGAHRNQASRDPLVTDALVLKLGTIRDPRVDDFLFETVREGWDGQDEATLQLIEKSDERALDAALTLVSRGQGWFRPDGRVHPALGRTLSRIAADDPRIGAFTESMLGLLRDVDEQRRGLAAPPQRDIDRPGRPAAPGRDRRELALRALGWVGGPTAVATLLAAADDRRLDDRWFDERRIAVEALSDPRHMSAVPHLIRLLTDPDMGDSAAQALGHIGDASAVPELLKMLSSTVDASRVHRSTAVATALGRIGDRSALPVLQEVWDGRQYLGVEQDWNELWDHGRTGYVQLQTAVQEAMISIDEGS